MLADADTGGREATEGIAAELHKLGCTVQVALPEGETGEDVADWLGVSKQHARERVVGLLQTYVPTSEPAPGPGLESRGAHQFEFSPVADAWRLLQAHADRILLAEGTDKRGAVERTVLALDDAGLWHNDGELLAAWHAELAGELILDTLVCSDGGSKPYGFAKWSGTALRPGGAEQCRKSVASVVLAARERDEPPPEGLTECHTRELNPLRYLGAPNGVIDLTTGRLLPPEEGRRCLVTFSLPDPYDPDATHPDVERLTAHLDSELADYLWDDRSATRSTDAHREHSWPSSARPAAARRRSLTPSPPRSAPTQGRSPLARSRPNRSGRGAESATPSLASVMPPRRLAFGPEIEKERPDPAKLKAITGADLQGWRLLYDNFSDQTPTATLVLSGNKAPERLGLDDPAIVDRCKAVPYPPLAKADRDPRLVDAFKPDTPGSQQRRQALAAKLIRHAAKLTPGTPPEPPLAVLAEVDKLRERELGPTGLWLRDHLRPGREHDTATTVELKQEIGDALGAEGEGSDWRLDGQTWQQVLSKVKRIHPMIGNTESVRPSGGQACRGWKGWTLA